MAENQFFVNLFLAKVIFLALCAATGTFFLKTALTETLKSRSFLVFIFTFFYNAFTFTNLND